MVTRPLLVWSLILCMLNACDKTPSQAKHDRLESSSGALSNFSGKLLSISTEYQNWNRVSETARLAPELCRQPTPTALKSKSKDSATHGRKLYYLFCNEPDHYRQVSEAASPGTTPTGFTIVKEAHATLEPKRGKAESAAENQTLEPGPIASLFIMTKYDDSTPGTDKGWLYGTVDPSNNEVTSAGIVASCVQCHEQALKGRLFGLTH